MNKIKIYCITNEKVKHLEKTNLTLVGVGKKSFPRNYINCTKGKNIQYKEKNYSELVFHYWFWKNELKKFNSNTWIGFCQKRRFWVKSKVEIKNLKKLKKNLINKPDPKWKNFESIICKSIRVDNPKKMKIIKRGWKNLVKDPSIFFDNRKQTIKLHFDMHHGFNVLDKAIDKLDLKDRNQFRKFVNENISFNPHIMFISKKKIINKWFKALFKWLFKCEKIFGFSELKGYDQERLYAYLAERYLSFWFKKYTKYLEWNWSFYEHKLR